MFNRVMAGLVPAIYVFLTGAQKDGDAREDRVPAV
jgi:hypothetical protein